MRGQEATRFTSEVVQPAAGVYRVALECILQKIGNDIVLEFCLNPAANFEKSPGCLIPRSQVGRIAARGPQHAPAVADPAEGLAAGRQHATPQLPCDAHCE